MQHWCLEWAGDLERCIDACLLRKFDAFGCMGRAYGFSLGRVPAPHGGNILHYSLVAPRALQACGMYLVMWVNANSLSCWVHKGVGPEPMLDHFQ